MNDDRPEIDRSEALANWPSADRSALRTDSGLFSKRRDSMNRAIENANIRGNFASALSRQARLASPLLELQIRGGGDGTTRLRRDRVLSTTAASNESASKPIV